MGRGFHVCSENRSVWRRAWRAGKPWGNAGYVAKRPDGTAAPLLPALGLVAPQYGLTDAEAEERALTVALYTDDDGQLFRVLNAEFSSATRAALGGELSPRLRACIPFAKLLEVALCRSCLWTSSSARGPGAPSGMSFPATQASRTCTAGHRLKSMYHDPEHPPLRGRLHRLLARR